MKLDLSRIVDAAEADYLERLWLDPPTPPHGPDRPSAAAGDTCAECDQPVLARGWCQKHYQRWSHHGHPHLLDHNEHSDRRDAARHGTRYLYDRHRCRCLPCALANSRYLRDLDAGNSRRVPVADVLPHVDALLRSGWTARDIEREAGLSNSTVWRLRHSGQASVNSRTATSLLALPLPDDTKLPAGPLVAALEPAARNADGIRKLMDDTDVRMFYRVRERGWADQTWADRIACTVLGMPLELLYGTDHATEEAA